MKYTNKQLLDAISENGLSVSEDSLDFEVIKLNVDDWLDVTDISFKGAVENTVKGLDPWDIWDI